MTSTASASPPTSAEATAAARRLAVARVRRERRTMLVLALITIAVNVASYGSLIQFMASDSHASNVWTGLGGIGIVAGPCMLLATVVVGRPILKLRGLLDAEPAICAGHSHQIDLGYGKPWVRFKTLVLLFRPDDNGLVAGLELDRRSQWRRLREQSPVYCWGDTRRMGGPVVIASLELDRAYAGTTAASPWR